MPVFDKYRPASHFIPPHSWSNDPCGAVYIPETKEYIWCYQWNPGKTAVGNSAWGCARSKDMITWVDCKPALELGPIYDCAGVFSGSITARQVEGKTVLYLFYTSVSAVPIHWTVPYIKDCESQSVAISIDFGHSWQKYENNPLLTEPPYAERTTGWRDPCVSTWANMSQLRGISAETNYMLLSSGRMGTGSQMELYESEDLLHWEKVSTLLKVSADIPIARKQSLLWGRNFECSSFLTMEGKDYLIAGVEENGELSSRHSTRYVLWMSGSLVLDWEGKPEFRVATFGLLDHGILYAPHIARGSRNEQLQLGWIDEDENVQSEEQGWLGMIALPRAIFEVKKPMVDQLPKSELHRWNVDKEAGTMTTFGVRPADEVKLLRKGSKQLGIRLLSAVQSKNYELESRFTKMTGREILSFNVRQSPQDREVTRITFHIAAQTVTIDRRQSSIDNGNQLPNIGTFGLLNFGTKESPQFEDLQVRIFVDNSVIEVYANDRFAMSSRIYPGLETSNLVSCSFWNGSKPLDAANVELTCYDGLVKAWPRRETAGMSLQIIGEEDEEEDEEGDSKPSIETVEYVLSSSIHV